MALCLTAFALTLPMQPIAFKLISRETDSLALAKISSELVDAALAEILQGQSYAWEEYGTISRETINYGIDFLALEKGEKRTSEIPLAIVDIRQAVFDALADKIKDGSRAEDYENTIASIYGPGQFIPPHIDRGGGKKQREYSFGEVIMGVILVPDTKSRLGFIYHEIEGKPPLNQKPSLVLDERVGTAFAFQGRLRHHPYFHVLPPVEHRRVSLTFRTVYATDFS